jgi:hypothetical protein
MNCSTVFDKIIALEFTGSSRSSHGDDVISEEKRMTSEKKKPAIADLGYDDLSLTNPEFFATGDPHELWRRLRAHDPVHWTQTNYGRGYWSVTKLADVRAVYTDPILFSAQRSGATLPLSAEFADPARSPSMRLAIEGAMLASNDPPRHNKMRQALHQRFLPRAVAQLDGFVTDLVAGLVGELIERGECDFVNDVVAKLPSAVIFEIMQIPREDWPMMFEMANMGSAPADQDYGAANALEAPQAAVAAFYGNTPASWREAALARLVPQPVAISRMPLQLSAGRYGMVKRAYIECLRDQALTIEVQRKMQSALPCDFIAAIDTDHSPFYSQPETLVKLLMEIGTRFD